jgi:hypothetical protein
MDGETEGYLGGIFGEVSPSVSSMPIATVGSVPFSRSLAKAGRPAGVSARSGTALTAHEKRGPRTGGCCQHNRFVPAEIELFFPAGRVRSHPPNTRWGHFLI